jgi:hypothetical protein
VIAIGQLALASPARDRPVPQRRSAPLGARRGQFVFMIGMVDITLQTYSAVLKAMSATHEQKRLTAASSGSPASTR